ncbi:MAG: biotin--[acetyl-CoA-carboxylase] ligase [Acetobacteraceae bacterium]|nr:biotin--[acetyl-CoA-carboxylase] ligase [Acetobacteraceae bacterium]
MSWRLRRYASLPSTSDLCVQLARGGEPDGLAVLADRQTEGRGSRGRTWESPPGALCLSVLLRPREPPAASGQWALLAALALYGALAPFAPGEALSLKWPNDVLLAGRKLGGILLDAAMGASGLDWLVIGFGANLEAAPEGAGALPTAPEPSQVATSVLEHLDRWRRVRLVDGWAPVRAAWLARAHPAGTPLRVRTATLDVGGAFDGLAENGALLLRVPEGSGAGRVRAFATGDVLLDREG